MSLSEQVASYYYKHFTELPADKQFHFVSRLSSWNNDPQATILLENIRPSIATAAIKNDLKRLLYSPPEAKINAAELREPFFIRYPTLRGRIFALFRVRHLLYHYNIDARDTLLELVSIEELRLLSQELQRDTEALKILSTYAINYIYLVDSILYPHPQHDLTAFSSAVLTLGDNYGTTTEDTLLLIYLYTHCIIGASNFYQHRLTYSHVHNPDTYIAMLDIVQQRIAQNYWQVNLDNKFEYLVCSKILNKDSPLESQIIKEASQSVSPQGTFIVDTINKAAQSNKTSFIDSEHRNVLFIMSQRDFLAK